MTNANQPLPYADDVETIPPDEADDIQRVVQAMEVILAQGLAKSGQFRADVHVKTHGYVQGEFRVLPNLPDELSQGLFEREGVFPAVVRFSNAASQAQPDAIPDGRGMAIKVLGVESDVVLGNEQLGPTQDFVMINHPVFFARNVKDFLRLEQVGRFHTARLRTQMTAPMEMMTDGQGQITQNAAKAFLKMSGKMSMTSDTNFAIEEGKLIRSAAKGTVNITGKILTPGKPAPAQTVAIQVQMQMGNSLIE